MTGRLPRIALLFLLVGLALHNLAMALLWQAGVRDTALDVVAAWKDVLLLAAVVLALAAALPKLLAYDDRTDPNALAVRAQHEALAAASDSAASSGAGSGAGSDADTGSVGSVGSTV